MNTPNNPTPTIVEALKAALNPFAEAFRDTGGDFTKIERQLAQRMAVEYDDFERAASALLRAEGESREGDSADLRALLKWIRDDAAFPALLPANIIAAIDIALGPDSIAQPHHPTASDDKEERAQLQLIDERDNAESALGEAYRVAAGREPKWSNLFGYADAVREIGDAASRPTVSVEAVARIIDPWAFNTSPTSMDHIEARDAASSKARAILALTAQQHPGLGSGGPTEEQDGGRSEGPQEASPESGAQVCDWPEGVPFRFHDEPGEHDPCYVVMPDGASLPLNHHAGEGFDIARAKFIVAACNAFWMRGMFLFEEGLGGSDSRQQAALIMANIEEVDDWTESLALWSAHCHAQVLYADLASVATEATGVAPATAPSAPIPTLSWADVHSDPAGVYGSAEAETPFGTYFVADERGIYGGPFDRATAYTPLFRPAWWNVRPDAPMTREAAKSACEEHFRARVIALGKAAPIPTEDHEQGAREGWQRRVQDILEAAERGVKAAPVGYLRDNFAGIHRACVKLLLDASVAAALPLTESKPHD